MRNKKQYRIDLTLFIASITVLLFLLFANYVRVNNWDKKGLSDFTEFLTIPMILIASIIPLAVVFRFISKKTESRTLSMMAVLFSLMTAILISYTTLV